MRPAACCHEDDRDALVATDGGLPNIMAYSQSERIAAPTPVIHITAALTKCGSNARRASAAMRAE